MDFPLNIHQTVEFLNQPHPIYVDFYPAKFSLDQS